VTTDHHDPDIGGDCVSWVALCRAGVTALADAHRLSGPEVSGWILLILEADFRTGIVSPITRDGVAAVMRCSRPTAKSRVEQLARAGLIEYHFPQGHPGWVAVTSYLDVVRVRPASQAAAIRDAITARIAPGSGRQDCNGAERAAAAPSKRKVLPSENENLPIEGPPRLGKDFAEPPGETPDFGSSVAAPAPCSSTAAVGGQARRTTSTSGHEATRPSREDLHDTHLLGHRPAPRPSAPPGAECERCTERRATLTAYWGDRLCSKCAQQVAALLDAEDAWPPVEWATGEAGAALSDAGGDHAT